MSLLEKDVKADLSSFVLVHSKYNSCLCLWLIKGLSKLFCLDPQTSLPWEILPNYPRQSQLLGSVGNLCWGAVEGGWEVKRFLIRIKNWLHNSGLAVWSNTTKTSSLISTGANTYKEFRDSSTSKDLVTHWRQKHLLHPSRNQFRRVWGKKKKTAPLHLPIQSCLRKPLWPLK